MPLKRSKVKMNFIQLRKECIFSFLGVILSVGALLFAMFWPDIFEMMIAKEMALRPDSRVYDTWKSPALALNLDIYFFNWTNPTESIKNESIKPILEQIGPYRFSLKIDKVDIKWHPNNSTVTFKRKNFYYFDEEYSKGKLDDMITTVNMVALSASAKARTWGFIRRKTVSVGLNMYNQKIAITKPANELLFDGFQEDMIDAARELPIFGSEVSVPFDKAGWFYPRNGSEDLTGIYNMFTGQDDIKKIGKMNTWNYKKDTGFFDSYCGMINGSAGEFYPPRLQKKDGSISFFNPDLCRSITFDYEETVKVQNLEGYKFSGGPRSIDNGTLYPENQCFCNGECLPSGVINITACRFGAPVFMSYPHFYQADSYYLDQVEGLNPSKEKHQFYIILEPTTGVTLEVAARFQINLLIRPIPNVNLYSDVKTVVMPILWFEQKVRIGEEMASEINVALNVILTGQICAGIIFAIGLIMIFWFPIDRCIRRNYNHNKKLNKNNSTNKKDNNIEIGGDKILTPQQQQQQQQQQLQQQDKLLEGSPLLDKTDSKLLKVKFIESNAKNTTTPFETAPSFKTETILEKSEKL